MNEMIVRQGLRMAGHDPRRALRVSLIAAPLVTGKMRGVAQGGRQVVVLVDPVRRAATDPKVRKEMRRAVADVSFAVARAQRIGVAEAIGDRCVTRKLILAAAHASRAVRYSVAPPHHRARNATIVVLGTGAVAGAAYGGWKATSRSTASSGVRLAEEAPVGSVATDQTPVAEGDRGDQDS